MTTTFTNKRDGFTVTLDLTPEQMLAEFAKTASADHFAWYWMAKHVQDHRNTTPANANMIAFLGDSFLFAIGMGLTRPKIRIHYRDKRFKIYLSKRGTICFYSGNVRPGTHEPDGNEEYMGCLIEERFLAGSVSSMNYQDRYRHAGGKRPIQPVEQELLDKLAADPVGFLAQVGKDMDGCCFCNSALTDPRSKEVGYGPVCAANWGLPWGKTNGDQNFKSFAELWASAPEGDRKNIRGVCQEIRTMSRNHVEWPFLWEVLGDLLEQNGHKKRPTMPESRVVIPTA